MPPTYLFAAIIAIIGIHFLFPGFTLLDGPYRLIGLLPLAMGIYLNLAADRSFRRHQTTVKPFDRSNTMVTEGVFGWSRNPMYLGMSMILLGITMVLGTATSYLIVGLFVVLMERVFIHPEEINLEQEFGAAFHQYKQRVRRWI